MGDPGLRAGRELGPTLVMGPSLAGLHAACMLGDRYSVLAVSRNLVSEHRALARDYGLESRLASVRSVEIPVLQLNDDVDLLVDALSEQARLAVVEDGADVLVLGCTGMIGLVDPIEEPIAEEEVHKTDLCRRQAGCTPRAGLAFMRRRAASFG
jgi:allantoin racemase